MTLTRRDFIGVGAMVASASVGKFAVPLASALPASSSQGEWVRSGMIDAGGTHEPYIFVVRRGGQPRNARQISDYEQSEDLIKQLHAQGVDVFHTHFYKGFGMAAEKEGMEETRTAVAIAHRYGMKADTYIQGNSMMYETLFVEEPRAVNWIQRDIAGLPILLTYGYQQSYRYSPCFSNQEYLDYLKKVVRYAVVEVNTDYIHLDNFSLDAEPDSCHCHWCVDGFRKLLKTKYSPEQLRERFGFENMDCVNPPQWNRSNPPEKMEIIFDPAFQEWIDFRCQMMSSALRQISEYAKSLNSKVAIEVNCGGIDGKNRPWTIGVDHARLLKFTEAFFDEENDPSAYHADGRLVSKIRSYKLARIYNNTVLTYIFNSVELAEALAFNQTLGFVGVNPLPSETLRYIDFYRKHKDFYLDSVDVTPVAVLRSYASLTYNNARCQLSTVLVEQALIQSGIPFALIFDDHLEKLAEYKVLILPNSECLSDEQLSLIRRYVDGGGGLIVTEQAGLYDEWRRVRTNPGLSGLVDGQPSGSVYKENTTPGLHPGSDIFDQIWARKPETNHAVTTSRKQVGSGRVAYIPAVQFDGTMPALKSYFAITNSFWKRPQNWKDIADDVHWAAESLIPITVDGPEFLVANCTRQPRNQRFLVHLVNYNALNASPITSVPVRVALPNDKKALRLTIYSPDSNDARVLNFTNDSSGTRFTVPEIVAYALIVIEW